MTILRREVRNPCRVYFFCPGCQRSHIFVIPPDPHAWSFNGDTSKPTIRPSHKETSHHKGEPQVCHSFITDGQIAFENDTTAHDLRGVHDLLHFPYDPSPGIEDFV